MIEFDAWLARLHRLLVAWDVQAAIMMVDEEILERHETMVAAALCNKCPMGRAPD